MLGLRLVELPLRGCKYTWTNKQQNPLLERLDWFFTSNAGTTMMPITYAIGLVRDTSDHTPCVITATSTTPRPQIFHFENYWLQHEDFLSVMHHGWNDPTDQTDSAKMISAKFKNLRRAFKIWKAQLPNLAATITCSKQTLQLLYIMEEFRDLTLE